MVVPDFQTIMLPFLNAIGDGNEHNLNELVERLAKEFKLSDEDRRLLLPSGRQRTFDNRVGWTRTYLKKAGLLDSPGIGKVRITARGLDVLKTKPSRIDVKFLTQYPEFKEFHKKQHEESTSGSAQGALEVAPLESLESGYKQLRSALEDDLLERVKKCSPSIRATSSSTPFLARGES